MAWLLLINAFLINSQWEPQGYGRYYLAESFSYSDLASSSWKHYKSYKKSDLFLIEKTDETVALTVKPFSQKQQITRGLTSEFLFKNHLYFQVEVEFPYNEDQNSPFAIKLVNSKGKNLFPVITLTVGFGSGKINAPMTVGLAIYKCYGKSGDCVEEMMGFSEISVDLVRMYPKRISIEVHSQYYAIWVDSKSVLNSTVLELTKTQSVLSGLSTITDIIIETPDLVESADPLKLDNIFLTDNRRALVNWTNQIQMFRHESIYDFLVRLNYTNRFRLTKYVFFISLPILILGFLVIWRLLSIRNAIVEDEDADESKVEVEVPDTVRRR